VTRGRFPTTKGTRLRTPKKASLAVALLSAIVVSIPHAGIAQVVESPTLRLFSPSDSVTVIRYGRGPIWLDSGAFIAAQDGPFELRVGRSSYTSPITGTQVIRNGASQQTRSVPAELLDGFNGLKDFFTIEIRNEAGDVIRSKTLSWCPNGYDRQRVSDAGPSIPTYPTGCPYNPFTMGMPMGIDQDWAVNVFETGATTFRLREGTYLATVGITEAPRAHFEIAPEDATTSFELVVKSRGRNCPKCGRRHHRSPMEARPHRGVPTDEAPDPAILPDLIPLPSWGINVEERRKGTFLNFGATVWVGGASSLVVEGFRRPNEEVMDAFQYFYQDGEPVGRAPVGEMEYDERRGHNHWHFRQFVAYRLLDETQTEVVLSTKEAFCLAPTDALDLLMPGAVLNPESTGLHTSCGSANSIWIRETLPLGWGDTYHQTVPGQSFDISDLPNGTYYIEIEANPDHNLHEQDLDNNSEIREVIIRGKKGARRVEVPAWNGIDTD
jgi:hypothetical protein